MRPRGEDGEPGEVEPTMVDQECSAQPRPCGKHCIRLRTVAIGEHALKGRRAGHGRWPDAWPAQDRWHTSVAGVICCGWKCCHYTMKL